MDQFKSDFLRSLHERGYIHQVTDAAALDAHANSQVISAYIGFDATADSLHIGSLVQIMMLRRLQQAGHRPIVLMGGGTTKIGAFTVQGLPVLVNLLNATSRPLPAPSIHFM